MAAATDGALPPEPAPVLAQADRIATHTTLGNTRLNILFAPGTFDQRTLFGKRSERNCAPSIVAALSSCADRSGSLRRVRWRTGCSR
jgi:hypothetical protein